MYDIYYVPPSTPAFLFDRRIRRISYWWNPDKQSVFARSSVVEKPESAYFRSVPNLFQLHLLPVPSAYICIFLQIVLSDRQSDVA